MKALEPIEQLYRDMVARWLELVDAGTPDALAQYRTAKERFISQAEGLRLRDPRHLNALLDAWMLESKRCGKIVYLTQAEAKTAGRAIRKRSKGYSNMETYHCARCDAWHLTSTDRRDYRKRNSQHRERVRNAVIGSAQ